MTIDHVIQMISGSIGTLGFAFLFNLKGNKMLMSWIGGFISSALYCILSLVVANEVLNYFIVSVAIALYSEALARLFKTPTSTFCMVSLIPLVPGSSLYYTMAYGLSGETELFFSQAVHTLALSGALSVGIVLVTTLTLYFKRFCKWCRCRKERTGL